MENNSFPVMPTDKNTERPSRNVPIYLVAVAGGVIGMVAAYVALWLTPNDVESEHDYAISFFYYLVPTYSTLVGIWIGCLKRTKTNLLAGPLIGFFFCRSLTQRIYLLYCQWNIGRCFGTYQWNCG